ncbi:MAG TPA: hypothetical protein VEX88_10690 [Glaciibacter sp.]|nr:hypothetical protein [Glaciibacter sp.]
MLAATTLILTLGLLVPVAHGASTWAASPTPGPGSGCAFSGGALICGGTQPTAVPVPERGSPTPDPTLATPADPAPTSPTPTPANPMPGEPVDAEDSGQTNVGGAIVVGIVTAVAATGLAVHLWHRRSRGAVRP